MPPSYRAAFVSLIALTACQDALAPSEHARQYVVRLRPGAEAPTLSGHRIAVGALNAVVATMSATEAAALRSDAAVAGIEPDYELRGAGVQLGASWGLDRIDQSALPLAGTYLYPSAGSPVTVYILDSGVDVSHPEFGGRAESGPDFNGSGTTECNGHGTHVAGVVAGATYGVAKDARIVSVRVLDCELRGTVSQAVAGLGWVVQQHKAHPGEAAVVNLSLEGTSPSTAFDQAVTAAIDAGVTVVVAAGNSAGDACTASPSRAVGAIAVAASDRGDGFASFSSRGACVALAAPGVDVPSAWTGGNCAVGYMSGAYAAAPFVAGAAALYLARFPRATPAQVRAALVANASTGTLVEVPAGTANRLVGIAFLRQEILVPVTHPGWGPRVEQRCAGPATCTASVTSVL